MAIAIVQDARSEPHGQVEGGDLVAPPREVHEQLVAPRAPQCEEALDLVRVRVRVHNRSGEIEGRLVWRLEWRGRMEPPRSSREDVRGEIKGEMEGRERGDGGEIWGTSARAARSMGR